MTRNMTVIALTDEAVQTNGIIPLATRMTENGTIGTEIIGMVEMIGMIVATRGAGSARRG